MLWDRVGGRGKSWGNRSVGRPDAKEGASRRELRAKGDENVGEEVDDDDDDDDDDGIRSWVVFELRALVAQAGNGSRRMAGMT